MSRGIKDMLSKVRGLSGEVDTLEHRASMRKLYGHGITAEIDKGGVVFIRAPRHTVVKMKCWVNDTHLMTEEYVMGHEDHVAYLQEIESLRNRITALEKQL